MYYSTTREVLGRGDTVVAVSAKTCYTKENPRKEECSFAVFSAEESESASAVSLTPFIKTFCHNQTYGGMFL